jgi:hypothetical protein
MKKPVKTDRRIALLTKGHSRNKKLPSEKAQDIETTQISVHLETELHLDVKSKLARQGKTFKDLITELLTEWNTKNK